jgi:hypothetical protein
MTNKQTSDNSWSIVYNNNMTIYEIQFSKILLNNYTVFHTNYQMLKFM